jgi:hypothetical protein
MTETPAEVNAKLVISGTFECRDATGNLIKTIELKTEVPLSQEQMNDDQRSE